MTKIIHNNYRKWTEQEKAMLSELVWNSSDEAVRWKDIAKHFPTKTAKQCYDCFTLLQKPDGLGRHYERWSHDDEEKFLAFVRKNGKNWKLLQAELFPARSMSQLKNKFRQSLQSRLDGDQSLTPTEQSSCMEVVDLVRQLQSLI